MRRWILVILTIVAGHPALAGRGRWTTGGSGPSGGLVVADPTRSGVVYAPGASSLFRSADGGGSWSLVSSLSWLYSLCVDPTDPDVLYFGAFSIYRSDDAGRTWSPIAASLTANYVGPIVVAPGEPDVLYVETQTLNSGTYYTGVYAFNRVARKPDGTYDWSIPDPDFTTAVTSLVADASSPGAVFASAWGGVHRTTNAGGTWSALPTGVSAETKVTALAIAPGTPSRIYAPIWPPDPSPGGVLVSGDGGDTWELETEGLPDAPLTSVAVDPRFGAVYVGSDGRGIFRSLDGGRTWQPFNTGLTSLSISSIAIDAAGGRVYAGTGDGVFAIDPLSIDPAAVAKPAVVRPR